jgi:hypothetical protein
MRKILMVLVFVGVLVGLIVGAYNITSAITSPTETSQQKQQVTAPALASETIGEETPSTAGRVFVFILLFGIVVFVIVTTYKEKRGATRDARGAPTKIPWKDILLQPVFIAIAGVVILNALANLFIYPTWRWFWDHQTLFWGTNMALVLFVHFITKKEPVAKWVASGIGFLIFFGFVTTITINYQKNGGSWFGGSSAPNKTPAVSSMSFDDAPMEIALREICMCESGCRQFESDGKTPFKNRGIPQKGIKPSDAFGKYQFLESHREPAKKLGFELNTEAGQDGYARYRYSQTRTKDWEYDEQYGGGRACWGPKLLALGYGKADSQAYTVELEAPVGEFGSQRSTEKQFFDWGASTDAFIVRDQKGAIAVYNPSKGIMQNLPYPSKMLEFKSLGDKPATVKLKLARVPLVKM